MPTTSRAIGAPAGSSCPTVSRRTSPTTSGRLRPYDLDTGALGEALPAVGADDRFPVLVASPDGRSIAMASRKDPRVGPTTVGVIDLATGSLAFDPMNVDGSVTSAVFLPDGRLALAIGEDGRLVVVDAGTGATVTTVDGVAIPEDDGATWRFDPARWPEAILGGPRRRGAAPRSRGRDAPDPRRRDPSAPPDPQVLAPADAVERAGPRRRDGGDVGTARDGPHRSHHREDRVERPRHVEVHQPPGDRATTACCSAATCTAGSKSATSRPGSCSDSSAPRTGTAVPCGRPPGEPSSSASGTTSQWSHGGGSTTPVRSRAVAPGWSPCGLQPHGGPLAPRTRRRLREDDTYGAGLLDTSPRDDDGDLRRPVDPLLGSCRHRVRHLAATSRWQRGLVSSSPAPSSAPMGMSVQPAADGVVVYHVDGSVRWRIDTGKDQMLIRYEDERAQQLPRPPRPEVAEVRADDPRRGVGNASHQPDRRPDRGRHQQRGGGLRRADRRRGRGAHGH